MLLEVAFYKGKDNWKKYVVGGGENALLDSSDLALLEEQDFTLFDNCSTFCNVEFGAITVVHLQAQILALVDYLQGGVLGVLFPSDASGASELESSQAGKTGEGLFKIRSNTVRLVMPTSPSSSEKVELHLEGMHILHRILPDEAGGKTKGRLGEVMLVNSVGGNMCKERISISLDVTLPPPMAKTRTAVVNVGIKDVNLVLTHEFYQCLMSVVDFNLTSDDTALRSSAGVVRGSSVIATRKTHAGTDINEGNSMDLKLDLHLDSLSVELFNDFGGRICKVTARETLISSLKDVKNATMTTNMTLDGLDVIGRSTVDGQASDLNFFTRDPEAADGEGLFRLVHVSRGGENSSGIDIRVNGPRIKVLPELINAMTTWAVVERKESTRMVGGAPQDSKQTINFVSSGCRLELVQKSTEEKCANSTLEVGGDLQITYTAQRGGGYRGNSSHLSAKNLEVIKVSCDEGGKVQIIEPVGFELQFQKREVEGGEDKARRDETKVNFCSDVGMDVKLSMRDLLTMGRVLDSLSEIGEEKEQAWSEAGEGENGRELNRLAERF
jgi:hypothetical protein